MLPKLWRRASVGKNYVYAGMVSISEWQARQAGDAVQIVSVMVCVCVCVSGIVLFKGCRPVPPTPNQVKNG